MNKVSEKMSFGRLKIFFTVVWRLNILKRWESIFMVTFRSNLVQKNNFFDLFKIEKRLKMQLPLIVLLSNTTKQIKSVLQFFSVNIIFPKVFESPIKMFHDETF